MRRTAVIAAIVLVGCGLAGEPLDAASDLDAGADPEDASDAEVSVDATSDAPSFDAPPSVDAPRGDATLVPVDAPAARGDASEVTDAPFVGLDAASCASGDYALENTPIRGAPVSLRHRLTSGGWREAWRDDDGILRMHFVADDLEHITTEGALEGAAFAVAGSTYVAEPTDAVDTLGEQMLVVFRPPGARDFYAAIYGLDGVRRAGPVWIDASASARIDAAWTGSGWSLLATEEVSLGLGALAYRFRRVELDETGALVSVTAPSENGDALHATTWLAGDWLAISVGWMGTVGERVAVHPDGVIERGPSLFGGGRAYRAGAYGPLGHRFWVVSEGYVVPSPPSVALIDAASGTVLGEAPLGGWLSVRDGAVAEETADTVGVMVGTWPATDAGPGTEVAISRMHVVPTVSGVVQLVPLQGLSSSSWTLRYLGDRYAVGWAEHLDEAVRCP